MPTVAPIQNNFTGGEFSPLVHGRTDIDRYKTGARKMENFLPTLQGSLVRRPPTRFVAEVKDSSKATRVFRFQFSTTQAYIIEVGDFYFRVFKDHGQVESAPNVPVEGFLPYSEAQLPQIKITQNTDVLYMFHPEVPPVKLQRYSDTKWEAQYIKFQDGPYLGIGVMPYVPSATAAKYYSYTMNPSATSGTITLIGGAANTVITNAVNNGSGEIRITHTAGDMVETFDEIWISGITGTTEANGAWAVRVINNTTFDLIGSTFTNAYIAGGGFLPLFFKPSDAGIGGVGRLMRLKMDANWSWVQITAYNSGVNVTAKVLGPTLGSTTPPAQDNFRYGLFAGSPTFGTTSGYPTAGIFHEDRLVLAGCSSSPQRVDFSNSGDYENFAPSALGGTVSDDNAIAVTINSNDVNAIKWLNTDEKGLLVGTDSSEWVVKPHAAAEALSPTNVSAKKASSYGSADMQPKFAGKSTLYLQKSSRRIRELMYFYDVDGFRANDMSILSEHLLATGIVDMDYQKEPHSILWCVRGDGALAAMTYDRDLDSVKAAWSKHVLGGYSNAGKTVHAEVESVAVISSPDGLSEEPWFVVKRYIDGGVKRYIEHGMKFFDDEDEQEDACFLDCSLTYDGAPSTTISGLSHLEGETVQVVADGAVQTDKVVTGGQITLDAAASVVHVGYHYNSDLQLLRFDAGSQNGTAIGKVRRTHLVGFMLHRTLGMQIGMSFDNLLQITFRADPDVTDAPPPLFTGIKSEEIEADSDMDNFICVRQAQPLPMQILAIMPQMKTQDNQ